jgi:hypothetical protein
MANDPAMISSAMMRKSVWKRISRRTQREVNIFQRFGRKDPAITGPHVYEVRPRRDKHGVDLISDALQFGELWYTGQNAIDNAIGYAKHRNRSHDAVIRVYDDAGNVIATHEHKGDFKEP